jgi:NADPH-dependent ferric siderophore reductase
MSEQPTALQHGEVLRVTPDGQFIWAENADYLIEHGDYAAAPSMPHILRALRERDHLHSLNAQLLEVLNHILAADDEDLVAVHGTLVTNKARAAIAVAKELK